jgi:hypothetical protein
MKIQEERELFADTIERFVKGQSAPHEWDDVVGVAFSDPQLEGIRRESGDVQDRFPPLEPGIYCSEEGCVYLLSLAARLRPDGGWRSISSSKRGREALVSQIKIPEIPLRPTPTSREAEEALGFRWAPSEVGRRHKLGGSPEWLASRQAPRCESCDTAMTFYAQLDSIGDNIVLGDCGMVYVFVCFDCFTATSILQTS